MEEVTRESIRPLLDLQRVDLALDRLKQRKADLPEQRELDEVIAERDETQKGLVEQQESFGRAEREQSRLETDVSMIEDKIAHETNRLYSGDISNPKELAAIQAEIDGLRRRKSHIEDQLLDVLDEREKAETSLNETKGKLAELEAAIGERTQARDGAAVEIQKELAQNNAEREALMPQIPSKAVELYADLRSKKSGVGVARLEGNVCRGCGVAISPLAMDRIKRTQDIIRCENCRRILVQ